MVNAHRLAKFVESKGNYENTEKIIHLLYDAYFTKNLLISDEKVLVELGMKVGCSKDELEKLLSGDDFSNEVRDDEDDGYQEGLNGVPYFLVNEKEVINGAASKEEMKEILLKVLNKNNYDSHKNDKHPEGVYCDENGCYFKKK